MNVLTIREREQSSMKRRVCKTVVLSVMTFSGMAASAAADEVVLFDAASDPLPVVLPTAPSPSQRYAAEEYAAYVKRMTGRDVEVVESDAGRRGVRLMTADDAENLGEDGFTLRATDGGLEIRGSKVRGCLYGIYEVLERFCGCRWYSSDFEKIPQVSHLAVPGGLDVTERPAFAMREGWWNDPLRHPLFAARLRLNGFNHGIEPVPEKIGGDTYRFGGGLVSAHTLYMLLPPERHFKDHPEYYSLVKGRREGKRGQLCLTNPEVIRLVTEEVLARIRRDPGARFYGISQNDWDGYCECEACKAIDDAEESHAGTMVRFVNAVAEAVEKEFPDVLIETLAYHYTRPVPKTARYRKNVVVCLCTHGADMAHPLATSDYWFNKEFRRDISKWKGQGRELYVWDYRTLFGATPAICPDVLANARNIRYFRDNGVKDLFLQGCGEWRGAYLEALKVWVSAKLMWNPDQDERALVREFTDGYYGAAASLVREDIDEAHRLFTAGKVPLYCEDRMPLCEMPDSFFAASRVRLDKAMDMVRDDERLSSHVRYLQFSLDFTELQRMRYLKKKESTWTDVERQRASVLARRLLAFLSTVQEKVSLGYDQGKIPQYNEKVKLVWERLADARGPSDTSDSGPGLHSP